MGIDIDDAAAFDHQDLARVGKHGQAVGHDDHRASRARCGAGFGG